MTDVLVAGATGTQGGSVVEHLLSGEYGEFGVHGLTRDASSEAAVALADRGVRIVEGDMTDADRMRELCTDVDAVFCVTTFFEAGTDAETEQGRTLAEAADAAGVDHFVYSSVGSADRDTGLAHFESKYAVERRIDELELPATVVRPVFFMQNFGYMMREEILGGRLAMPFPEGVEIQMVDARDIGLTAATALGAPDRFVGETIELAGDELTLEGIAATFAEHLGRDVRAIHTDIEEFAAAMGEEFAATYRWMIEVGYDADIDRLRGEYGIDPRSLEEFLDSSPAFAPGNAD